MRLKSTLKPVAVVAIFTLIILTACGGGGSSPTNPNNGGGEGIATNNSVASIKFGRNVGSNLAPGFRLRTHAMTVCSMINGRIAGWHYRNVGGEKVYYDTELAKGNDPQYYQTVSSGQCVSELIFQTTVTEKGVTTQGMDVVFLEKVGSVWVEQAYIPFPGNKFTWGS